MILTGPPVLYSQSDIFKKYGINMMIVHNSPTAIFIGNKKIGAILINDSVTLLSVTLFGRCL